MSTRWHIGAKQLRGTIAAYSRHFDLLEVGASNGPDGAPPLGSATLRRFRKTVPPPFDFAVVGGPQLARARPGEAVDRQVDEARRAIDLLHARCFVLRTTPDVTPAAVWRERIRKIASRFPRDATYFVWEPSGVWENEDAASFARSCDLVLAVDPMREEVPAGPVAYLRLRALGETRSFGAAALERLVGAVGARRDVFTVIETDSALAEAKQLRRLLKGARSAVGGNSRLVRPRASSIVVRDDEQE
jgi:Protein of unknown function DUF72